ncbi:hypothetical protein P7C71_g2420, partial [Lecanoromycetidae sp. Uapishka_2]
MDVEPYQVHVPEDALARLRQRLALVEYPNELEDAGWDLGSPLADVKRLTTAWKDEFDWRKAGKEINRLPQCKTFIEVDGFEPLNIHFLHQKSSVARPGNFLEVRKILPLLTNSSSKDTPSFHVVAPSLPNFGISDGVKKRGFGLQQYAETFHKLMFKLGYNEYVTQGGDWGFTMIRAMAFLYPKSCKASHLNVVEGGLPPSLSTHLLLWLRHKLTVYTSQERTGLERSRQHQNIGMGYDWQQRTKPQTIGYALADSPVALLAWIYEKMINWITNILG